MRPLCFIAASMFFLGAVVPASAVELKYCNDVPDPAARMDCLQDHISHLEQTLLTLGDQFAELSRALDQKLAATDIYKLQSTTQNKCLGLSSDNQGTTLVPCDHPDAWKLLAGSAPPKQKGGQSASSGTASGNSEGTSGGGNTGDARHGNHKGSGGGSGVGQARGGGTKGQGNAAVDNAAKNSTSDQSGGSSAAKKSSSQ